MDEWILIEWSEIYLISVCAKTLKWFVKPMYRARDCEKIVHADLIIHIYKQNNYSVMAHSM